MSDTTTLSLDRYAPDARALVAGAQALADERKHSEVLPLHLLVRALERDAGVVAVFRRAGVDVVELQAAAQRALDARPKAREPSYLSAGMLDLLERAQREANREKGAVVTVGHVLNSLSQELRGPAGELLTAAGVGPGSLRPHLSALDSVVRQQPTSASSPSTERTTRDLLAAAREGRLDRLLGRDEQLRRLLAILERRTKCHPLLVGEPGVGKGALISGLAFRLVAGHVPAALAGARLLELELGALVAGTRLRSELDDRMRALLVALTEEGRRTILVVRGLDQLFGGNSNAASSLGEVLRGPLERGELRLLSTTTPEGLRKIDDKDSALLRLLTQLPLEEPGVEAAVEIVRGASVRLEAHHGLEIGEGAVQAAVRLAKRYVQERFLPDSALDLLDEAAAAKRVAIEGLPPDVDALVRRVESLDAQLEALRSAEDADSRARREALEKELGRLRPEATLKEQAHSRRRSALRQALEARAEVATVAKELEEARLKKDFAKLGELEHGKLPAAEAKLRAAEQTLTAAGGDAGPPIDPTLMEDDVATTLAAWTGIPVSRMLEGEADKLLKMEERLSARVIGQPEAVSAVARAVRRSRVGLRDPKRPIGSFLFLGPSGVGKTELAKAVAELLFDDEQAMVRLDMSEFMERHMAQRLIGAPVGYADSEQGGFLTEAVRRRPFCVLLFDEVEKAHQDVFNLLLQVLDDGRLTDGRGRLADFSNCVVIMTSNIGSTRILDTDNKLFDSADGRDALRDVLMEELARFFRPELLNRIDETVVFRPLGKPQLRAIVDLQLAIVGRQLAARQLTLDVDDAVKDRIVALGYQPALGARPVKRAILRELQDPLAESLLRDGVGTVTTPTSGALAADAAGNAPASPAIVRVRLAEDGETLRFERA